MGDAMARMAPHQLKFATTHPLRGQRIKAVSCGFAHSVLVTENGEAFATGACDHGQLGLGHAYDQSTFAKIENLPQIKSVSCGYLTTAWVSVGGALFTAGSGQHGQLGHSILQDEFRPKRVEALNQKNIVKAICGTAHTVAIDDTGALYTWGKGALGRLGHGDSEDQLLPKLVSALANKSVLDVACGHAHTVALTKEGQVYSWGNVDHGQVVC